jgi:hypothetical protein
MIGCSNRGLNGGGWLATGRPSRVKGSAEDEEDATGGKASCRCGGIDAAAIDLERGIEDWNLINL